MEKMCRLGEAEEILAGMEQPAEVPDDIMESDEDYQIVISGRQVHIPELGLNLHEGIYCSYDEKAGGCLPDFAVTVIREEGQDGWLYYEQDGFLITVANFLHGKSNLDLGQLGQLSCFIRMPDGSLPAEE